MRTEREGNRLRFSIGIFSSTATSGPSAAHRVAVKHPRFSPPAILGFERETRGEGRERVERGGGERRDLAMAVASIVERDSLSF